MNILQVAKSSLPPAGHSHTVHYLSDALAKRGHQVTLLALRSHPRDRRSLLATEPFDYRVSLVKLPRTRGWLHNLIFTRAIRSLAAGGRFDVVHAHMLYPEGHCALKALEGIDVPLAVTGHGEDIQVDPACGYGLRLRPGVDRKVRRLLGRADGLVAIGEAMKEEMLAAGADPSRVSVIRTGYHLAPASSRPPAAARGRGYLLAVGRLIPKKGYDLLLRAVRIVKQARPRERLVIAGEGPERPTLERMAGDLGISGDVEFAGFVRGSDLTDLYRGARLFVCSSRWEPLGLVNLEAMACGLPVAAFRTDGIPEIVREGRCGLLAPPGDAAALASAIQRLLEDEALHARLSAGAVAEAALYRWDRVAEGHERFYEEVVARTGWRARPEGRATGRMT